MLCTLYGITLVKKPVVLMSIYKKPRYWAGLDLININLGYIGIQLSPVAPMNRMNKKHAPTLRTLLISFGSSSYEDLG